MASQNPTTIRLAKLLPHWSVEPPSKARALQPEHFVIRPEMAGRDEIDRLKKILREIKQPHHYAIQEEGGEALFPKTLDSATLDYITMPLATAQVLARQLEKVPASKSPFLDKKPGKARPAKRDRIKDGLGKFFGEGIEIRAPDNKSDLYLLTPKNNPALQLFVHLTNHYQITVVGGGEYTNELGRVDRSLFSFGITREDAERMLANLKAEQDPQALHLLQMCNPRGFGPIH